ncbi:tyrosine-type recombinase/integrase [Bradyrhizobium ivorense]|uniref:tyrosine-type recombinase/integrase n=1 Tax=Bradyrhizobium ivorense TaxID=2511166 RepID=UPI00322172D0
MFTGRRGPHRSITTRRYARLVSEWIGSVGLDPRLFGTHSLRRTKATLIYRRTGNLRAVQLLLGHTKIECSAPTRRWDTAAIIANSFLQAQPARGQGDASSTQTDYREGAAVTSVQAVRQCRGTANQREE